MASQFFNTFRTSRPLRIAESVERTLSQTFHGKRDKLKTLLFEKICKKYGISNQQSFILNEIDSFVKGNNLTDKDLKQFDKKINILLKEKGLLNKVSKSVDSKPKCNNLVEDCNNKIAQEINKNTIENESKELMNATRMSGASQLSNLFNNTSKLKNRNDPEVPEEELIKPKRKPHRFEFEHEEDMWNAFNNVNRRLYEQEKLEEKIKDKEIKRRTKEDLDNQIKHKLIRLEEERQKGDEYHGILIKHLDNLNKLEEDKQARIKNKILKEKENRDKQMWDQNYKKKLEKIKLRKYENQLLSYIQGEITIEKDNITKKKVDAIEALKRTLEENDRNKLKKEEQAKIEREDNLKSMEEYNRILEKQENDRVQYFKNIELKSTDFMAKMTDTVLKELKNKNNVAEERMNDFLRKKEERSVQEEKDKLEQSKQGKREMKKFLDLQVEEKKKINQFMKDLDDEQATIIKKDYNMYEEHKKNEAELVSLF